MCIDISQLYVERKVLGSGFPHFVCLLCSSSDGSCNALVDRSLCRVSRPLFLLTSNGLPPLVRNRSNQTGIKPFILIFLPPHIARYYFSPPSGLSFLLSFSWRSPDSFSGCVCRLNHQWYFHSPASRRRASRRSGFICVKEGGNKSLTLWTVRKFVLDSRNMKSNMRRLPLRQPKAPAEDERQLWKQTSSWSGGKLITARRVARWFAFSYAGISKVSAADGSILGLSGDEIKLTHSLSDFFILFISSQPDRFRNRLLFTSSLSKQTVSPPGSCCGGYCINL